MRSVTSNTEVAALLKAAASAVRWMQLNRVALVSREDHLALWLRLDIEARKLEREHDQA